MIFEETYTLSNGVKIPKIGLRTWCIENSNVTKAVCETVKIGYRHFDTAQTYENEEGIGKGIRECGMSHKNLFITTKLATEAKTYKETVNAIDDSLKKLGLNYIDMMLIHSP